MNLSPAIRQELAATGWRTVTLICAGAAVGWSVNVVHPSGVKFERYSPPTVCSGVAAQQEIRVLPPAQAARLCGDSRTLVADVRDRLAYSEGHVAGAVHIPCSGSRADVEQVRARLVGKEALVVYGDNEDQARQVASDLATHIGRSELSIAIIAGGWRAWFDAGMACASGPCDDCEGLVSHGPK